MMALLLISLLFLTLAFFLLKNNLRKSGQPPSPAKLPIIGNLHQLGTLPHRSLRALSLKHGPLMLLHLGATPHYVVSSADMAREVMKTHDVVFSDRPSSIISDRLFYGGKDVVFARYGDYWRKVRKISVLQLLSAKRVELFRYVSEEEVELMIKAISKSPSSINLSESLISTTNNILCRAAFGKKYIDEKQRSGIGFPQLLAEIFALLGVVHIGDLFPSLAWVAHIMGLDCRVQKNFKEWDNFLNQVIEEHLVVRREKNNRGVDNIVHVLLDIQENGEMGVSFDKESVKALLLEQPPFDKKQFLTYIIRYIKWLTPKLDGEKQEEFKKNIEGATKFLLSKLSDLQFGSTLKNKQMFNLICELLNTVARTLVSRMRVVKGNDKGILYLTPPRIMIALVTAWLRRGHWFDDKQLGAMLEEQYITAFNHSQELFQFHPTSLHHTDLR